MFGLYKLAELNVNARGLLVRNSLNSVRGWGEEVIRVMNPAPRVRRYMGHDSRMWSISSLWHCSEDVMAKHTHSSRTTSKLYLMQTGPFSRFSH